MKIPSKVDLVLWGLLALSVAGLLIVVKSWHHAATVELPALRAQLADARGQIAALEKAEEIDSQFARQLATFSEQQQINFKTFDETLRTAKVTREVRYETKDGAPVVCIERDRAEYRRLHNEAVRGSTDP